MIPLGSVAPASQLGPGAVRLVHVLMSLGVLLFGAVIAVFALLGSGGTDTGPGAAALGPLSLAHVALALVSWPLAALLPRRLVARQAAAAAARAGGSEREAMEEARRVALAAAGGAHLLRLAMLEGGALLGLVVCLMAVLGGELARQPLWALNAVSAVVFLAFAVVGFPSRERLEAAADRALRG